MCSQIRDVLRVLRFISQTKKNRKHNHNLTNFKLQEQQVA